MSKTDTKRIAFFIVLLLVITGGYRYWQARDVPEISAESDKTVSHAASDTVHFPANAPQLAYLQIKPVEAFPEPVLEPLNARIAYDDNYTARVFSPVAGRVIKISAEAGQKIKTGNTLLQLDSPDYASAFSDKEKAEADLQHKKQVFERAKNLFSSKGIAQRDLESSEADYHQAEVEIARATARLKNLSGDTPSSNGQFFLRAPVSGMISERQINIGSEVRPDASNPLFVITDPGHLWVLIDLPEQKLGKIKLGQPVSVEVDAYPDATFPGKITVIGEVLDPLTRRIQVRCSVDDPLHQLKPEMYAHVTPASDNQISLPRIPNTALFTQGIANFVFVELSPGILQRRRVELTQQGHDYSYVKQGIQRGERIVTSGALLLNSELSGDN